MERLNPKKALPFFLIALALIILAAILLRATWQGGAITPVSPSPAAHFDVSIPQKALLKNYVTVSVEVIPGTECALTFIAPSGETQVMDTVADENGQCTWKWKLEGSVGKGYGRLIFTINDVSESHFIEIHSSF